MCIICNALINLQNFFFVPILFSITPIVTLGGKCFTVISVYVSKCTFLLFIKPPKWYRNVCANKTDTENRITIHFMPSRIVCLHRKWKVLKWNSKLIRTSFFSPAVYFIDTFKTKYLTHLNNASKSSHIVLHNVLALNESDRQITTPHPLYIHSLMFRKKPLKLYVRSKKGWDFLAYVPETIQFNV